MSQSKDSSARKVGNFFLSPFTALVLLVASLEGEASLNQSWNFILTQVLALLTVVSVTIEIRRRIPLRITGTARIVAVFVGLILLFLSVAYTLFWRLAGSVTIAFAGTSVLTLLLGLSIFIAVQRKAKLLPSVDRKKTAFLIVSLGMIFIALLPPTSFLCNGCYHGFFFYNTISIEFRNTTPGANTANMTVSNFGISIDPIDLNSGSAQIFIFGLGEVSTYPHDWSVSVSENNALLASKNMNSSGNVFLKTNLTDVLSRRSVWESDILWSIIVTPTASFPPNSFGLSIVTDPNTFIDHDHTTPSPFFVLKDNAEYFFWNNAFNGSMTIQAAFINQFTSQLKTPILSIGLGYVIALIVLPLLQSRYRREINRDFL